MKFISKIISNIITVAYGVVCMPLLVLIAIFLPVFTIVEAFKIISTGYTVSTDYISMILAMSIIMYFSLRFRALRRIYKVFPSLFEALKYLVIAGIFIGVGAELLNWSYITLTPGRKIFGIASFIASLILWRVFASIYYRKNLFQKSC